MKAKNPFVVIDLKKYRAMIEEIEDMKDRLSIRSRIDDQDVPWELTEKKLIKKFKVELSS